MQLDTLDMLGGELSEGLVGAFDVVHIRAFACVVKGGDPTAVTERLCRMLSKLFLLSWLFFGFFWLSLLASRSISWF